MRSQRAVHPTLCATANRPMHTSTPWSCGHSLDVTCAQFAAFESSSLGAASAKPCAQLVAYKPPDCNHVRKVKCYLVEQYKVQRATFTCPQRVEMQLPRCGHAAKVSCAESVTLEKWQGVSCAEQGKVFEGQPYVPKDHPFREVVTFVPTCGHEQKMPCEEAFLMAGHWRHVVRMPALKKWNE